MTFPKDTLTADRVRELFAYDHATGDLLWRVGQYEGQAAGCVTKDGYTQIRFDGRGYYAHRIVWLHQHGELPPKLVDHRDGNKRNNRLSNLRVATVSENAQNRIVAKDNKSGYLGVSSIGKRYVAQIQIAGKHYRLGAFDDPSDAHSAYLSAKAKLHTFQPEPRPN